MILTITQIKEIIQDFLSENSNELECKVYEYEEKVRREGDSIPKIHIIKEGVFRVGKVDIKTESATFGFLFEYDLMVPMTSLHNDYSAFFELKSIENNLTNNHNLVYEISAEQWDSFVEKNEILRSIPLSVLHYNLKKFVDISAILRQNRNAKKVFSEMYDKHHSVLNSGISHKYIAEYLGISQRTLEKLFVEKELENFKKK
jgi:CRP-like cAMP-binding protein